MAAHRHWKREFYFSLPTLFCAHYECVGLSHAGHNHTLLANQGHIPYVFLRAARLSSYVSQVARSGHKVAVLASMAPEMIVRYLFGCRKRGITVT